jgi:hypothetical protein
MAISLLTHDLGMAGAGSHDDSRFVPQEMTPLAIHVVHVAEDTDAHRDLSSDQHHADPNDPVRSQCEISRAAVATATDTLDGSLLTIHGAVAPVVRWPSQVLFSQLADVTICSSRDRRIWFQVFLI